MRRRVGAAAIAAASLLAVPGAPASPEVRVEPRTRIRLVVRPLTADAAAGAPGAESALVIEPGTPAEVRLALAWPNPGSRAVLALRASAGAPALDGAQVVDVEAELTLAGGRKVVASRHLRFTDRTTALFEVFRQDERSLTLALDAEAETGTTLRVGPAVGPAVRFRLEVLRVLEGREYLLESNLLNTFLGEPVSYSFRLGDDPDAEAAHITLRPVRLAGEVLEVEAEISGALPVADDLVRIGRSERLLASPDAPSVLAFESGSPPTGYRFRLTARF